MQSALAVGEESVMPRLPAVRPGTVGIGAIVASPTAMLTLPHAHNRCTASRGLVRREVRARESIPALRKTVRAGGDIFLRAEALRSLIAIEGVEPLVPWLEELSRVPPVNVRDIARQALGERTGDNAP
jgi:hypothetical protein